MAAPEFPSVTYIICPAGDADGTPLTAYDLSVIIVPLIVPPVKATALLAWVAIVPSPSAVLAAPALVAAVPPSAMAMGEDRPLIVPPVMFTFPSPIATVGVPSWFSADAVTSTPVANVNPRVTVAVIAIYAISLLAFAPTPIASKLTCLKLGLPAVTLISTSAPYPRVRPVPKRKSASSVPSAVWLKTVVLESGSSVLTLILNASVLTLPTLYIDVSKGEGSCD